MSHASPPTRTVKSFGAVLGVLAGLALAAIPTVAAAQIDARVEIAAAVYAASATQAAAEKSTDAQLQSLRTEIADLEAKVRAGSAKQSELAAAQEKFVAELQAKDRAYSQAIAAFRNAVTDITKTEEGTKALAIFNNGDEAGALDVLDRLRAADQVTSHALYQKKLDLEDAAKDREIAALALEANKRGKVTVASVIVRFEEVTKLDPDMFWDWIDLDRLYQSAGRLTDARAAAQNAARVASTERDRSVAFDGLGNVLLAQGDLAGARKAYEESLAIFRRLAAADPNNAVLQRDVAVSLCRAGDILTVQGDLAGAHKAYEESLDIRRRLAAVDPSNAGLQRDLSVGLERIGDVLTAQNDLAGAHKTYEENLGIRRRLAADDPSNAGLQRDVSVSLENLGDTLTAQGDPTGARKTYKESLAITRRLAAADPSNAGLQRDVWAALWRLARTPNSGTRWSDVVREMESKQKNGTLLPADINYLDQARQNAAKEKSP